MNSSQYVSRPTYIHNRSACRVHKTLGCQIRDRRCPARLDTLLNETTDSRGPEGAPKGIPLVLGRQYLVPAFPISNGGEGVCHLPPIQTRPLNKLVKWGAFAWEHHPHHTCRTDFKQRRDVQRPP